MLSTTIDKYLYITCRKLPPFFSHRLRLVYGRIEECDNANELLHPSARETLKYLGLTEGLEIHYDGDLPAMSGMGSSSSFTVGMLNALYQLKNIGISPHELAKESIYIEQTLVGEKVGSQDQVNAAFGGLNRIEFFPNGDFQVCPVSADQKRVRKLEENLMLFFSGISRKAENIASTYLPDIGSRKKQLNRFHMMVDEGLEILKGSGDLHEFGLLLHESWMLKRSLSNQVSNLVVDELYDKARSAGALGGKLTGAGGGGMLLLYVPKEKQDSVKAELSEFLHIPFCFEGVGSRVIFDGENAR